MTKKGHGPPKQCCLCKKIDTAESPCSCFICNGCSERVLDGGLCVNLFDKLDEGMYCKDCTASFEIERR